MKRIIAAFTALLILAVSSIAVFAMPETGNITVVMINKATKKPIPGENVVLVKVADCAYTGTGYEYTLTSEFSKTGVDVYDTDAAQELYDSLGSSGAVGYTATSDGEGKASYTDCAIGAYLIYSQKNLFNPFVVLIPLETQEEYVFTVTAQPKIDYTEPTTTKPSNQSDETELTTEPPAEPTTKPTNEPTKTPEKELPYTGMLQYPVPLLGCVGLILFAKGFMDYYAGAKRKED